MKILQTAIALVVCSPITLLAQFTETKLSPSDGSAEDFFGTAAAITGSLLVVGSPEDDDAFTNSGSAYIFSMEGNTWGNEAKLHAEDPGSNDMFGASVDVTNDLIVVGAPGEGADRGAVYLFERDGEGWIQSEKLTASDGAPGNFFGYAVAVEGNRVVVGAYANDQSRGAAYVFEADGVSWAEQAKLTASDAGLSDWFGIDVAISGDLILVGAQWNDHMAENAGAGYIFRRQGSLWVEEAKLTATDAGFGHEFGGSVALSGETAILGADGDNHAGVHSGSAYVFSGRGGVWTQEVKLTASDAVAADFFGIDVSIDGMTALVGASLDDDAGSSSGSVYVFTFDGTEWVESDKLAASDGETGDHFGESVMIRGNAAVIGAPDSFGFPDPGAVYGISGFSPALEICGDLAAGNLASKCNAIGTINLRFVLLNNTKWDGTTITFLIDGEDTVSGTLTGQDPPGHSRVSLQVPHSYQPGEHIVEMIEPVCGLSWVVNCRNPNPESIGWDETARVTEVPMGTRLIGNHPNPFNPSTVISFLLAESGPVKLTIVNMLGQEVEALVDASLPAGEHRFGWDGAGFPTGVYYYRLVAKDFIQTDRMILLK